MLQLDNETNQFIMGFANPLKPHKKTKQQNKNTSILELPGVDRLTFPIQLPDLIIVYSNTAPPSKNTVSANITHSRYFH